MLTQTRRCARNSGTWVPPEHCKYVDVIAFSMFLDALELPWTSLTKIVCNDIISLFIDLDALEVPWISPEHWTNKTMLLCLSSSLRCWRNYEYRQNIEHAFVLADYEVLEEPWIPWEHWTYYDIIVRVSIDLRCWRNHPNLQNIETATIWLCVFFEYEVLDDPTSGTLDILW